MGTNSISALNASYANSYAYSDDFMARQLFKNNYAQQALLNSNTNLTNDTVSFSGKESDEKKGNSTTTVLITGGIAIGAFLLGKNWKAVKGYITKLLNGETGKKVMTALDRAKNKITGFFKPDKKHSIIGTSVTGASSPITNAQEARVIQNIETKHANSQARKLVENSLDDIVTPEMQAAHDKAIAYKPLSKKQKSIKAKMDAANNAQRAELNAVKNNAKGAEKLDVVAEATKKAQEVAQKIKDGAHINPTNKNIYFTKDGKVTQIRTAIANSNGEFVITDPKKIAKHLAKHKINLEEFALATS